MRDRRELAEVKAPKRPRDANQLAKMVVDIATGTSEDSHESAMDVNPMAALGRVSGLKGGRARAEKLTDERRAEIARIAAAKRWQRDDG